MSDATPWDDLPPYELERITALPFEEMLYAMFEHAPKASAGDVLSALGGGVAKSEIKRVRDRWKAERGGEPEADVPKVPTREAVMAQLRVAVEMNNSREADRWARALVALGRVGDVDVQPDTTEDWDRLSDARAGILIALTHQLHGEALTTFDERCLAPLPP